jgi:hypothetical protein
MDIAGLADSVVERLLLQISLKTDDASVAAF